MFTSISFVRPFRPALDDDEQRCPLIQSAYTWLTGIEGPGLRCMQYQYAVPRTIVNDGVFVTDPYALRCAANYRSPVVHGRDDGTPPSGWWDQDL